MKRYMYTTAVQVSQILTRVSAVASSTSSYITGALFLREDWVFVFGTVIALDALPRGTPGQAEFFKQGAVYCDMCRIHCTLSRYILKKDYS